MTEPTRMEAILTGDLDPDDVTVGELLREMATLDEGRYTLSAENDDGSIAAAMVLLAGDYAADWLAALETADPDDHDHGEPAGE